jgi:hypothetical protein
VKADQTQNTFNALKHFSRVVMQQGRVQLDSDWNAQADIMLHLLRRLAADVKPGAWGDGFVLSQLGTATDDVAIGAGSLYVDGILCELESTPVPISLASIDVASKTIIVPMWTVDGTAYAPGQYLQFTADDTIAPPQPPAMHIAEINYPDQTVKVDGDLTAVQAAAKRGARVWARRIVTYRSQSDLPSPPKLYPSGSRGKLALQAYLDVWERGITVAEDDSLREVALFGPDTAARTRVVWQVKTRISNTNLTAPQCLSATALKQLIEPGPVGLMRARTQPAQISPDPCTIAPDARYRGPENQLYRVEIHSGSDTGTPTFKMSRDNGTAVFPVVALALGGGFTTVTLANLGRDDRYGLAEGDYVEIEDDASVLSNAVQPLLQVKSIDRRSATVVLGGTVITPTGTVPSLHPLLRRWDHRSGDPAEGGLTLAADGAATVVLGQWLNLEDGVQIEFPKIDGATFRTSDYFLIPARLATGDIIWPWEHGTDAQGNPVANPVAKMPDGIVHHYAPLAILRVDDKNAPAVTQCGAPALPGGTSPEFR